MLTGILITAFITSMLLSGYLTSRVRRYTLKKNILDIPNERSSHSIATPRGGGLAVVFVLLVSIALTLAFDSQLNSLLMGLFFVVFCFALIGWQDDKNDIPAAQRLLMQIVISTIFIAWLAFYGRLGFSLTLISAIILILSVLWLVWMANLYNFMDGIDGISAVESITLSLVTAYWFVMADTDSLAFICLSVAGASLGFLYWNWSPAKIFMGDVGSLSLGAFFAVISIIGVGYLNIPISAFLILYSVYLVDAGGTLLHRVLKRERWWQAHRSHFYQRAVQSGLSHAQVSLAISLINSVLALLSSLVVFDQISTATALLLTAIIFVPLMFLINSRFNKLCRN